MKTALVYVGDDITFKNALPEFLRDKNYLDYKILAVLTDNSMGTLSISNLDEVKKFRPNFPTTLDAIPVQSVNKFVYKFVDAIFVLSAKNFGATINAFSNLGVEPRRLILWKADNSPGMIEFMADDGIKVVCFEGLEFHVKNQSDEDFVNLTLRALENQKHLHNMPREQYDAFLKNVYWRWMGRELDLDNPKTFTEKINWLKLYDSTPFKARLSDKYAVREWVENKIGEEHLVPLIGVWDSFDEINFDELPDRFVLKCNHGSGMNIIVKDKSKLDLREAREKINAWLATDYGMIQLELNYSLVKRKIIAEEYLEELGGTLHDFRFYCFNGEPCFVCVTEIFNHYTHEFRQGYYDLDWRDIGEMFEDAPLFERPFPKPQNLADLLSNVKILCKNFSCVRVDLYNVSGKVFFGEMTFIPNAGFLPYRRTWNYKRDLEIGNMIKL